MENFEEIKERILKQAIEKKACVEELERAKGCESWEQLQEVIADNFWWCIDKEILLPNGYYKTNRYEITIVNGKLEGEYKRWFESSGQLNIHWTYKDGKEHGEFKSWYPNGQPCVHCTYKNGELEGEYKSWYDNGQLYIHCTYKNGELEGEYKEWWDNGELVIRCTYKHGKFSFAY
jgi:hypothetical protein